MYTGEVEVDDEQRIVRWSNMSGTYKCPVSMAFQVTCLSQRVSEKTNIIIIDGCSQAGLPMATFEPVRLLGVTT